ncbi:MAG: hypothetical protein VYC52_03670, partial [Pseudomonadota bacterium]|nr:hypothetical protein [Pseudomonadota bacterium]
LLHFPDNPTSIYIAVGVMSLASALSIIDLGLSAGGFSVCLITVGPEAGLAYGMLYRSYLVWIAATLLASVNAIIHAFQLIFLMMTVSSAGEYLLFAITHAVPLGLYSFVVFYLNTNEIRDLFGLVPLNQDKNHRP